MSNQGNGGIHSKFQERLRNIRLSRVKKKKQNDDFVQDKVKEIREVIHKDIEGKVFIPKKRVIGDKENDKYFISPEVRNMPLEHEEQVIVKESIVKDTNEEIFTLENSDKPNKKGTSRKKGYSYVASKTLKMKKNKVINADEKKELLKELGTEIIERIKESFEEKLDELEVLESELFLLKQEQDNVLEINKVIEIKKKINELIDKINVIIEQYNLYNESYYIDNVVDIDDNVLADDIISYRELLDSLDSEKIFVKEYKALEEFTRLYDSLKQIDNDTENLQLSNEEKIKEYDIRDKKYDGIKLGLVSVLDIDKKCLAEIEKQNEYFDNLMSKINIIDREEYVTTHLRGIGELIGQSLRYMGLMMLSPLSGLVPSISMQTMATRNLIGNVYRNLHLEEVRHVHYEAVNYDSELNHHLCDVDYAENLIDDTLKDVERLKEDFMMIYDSKIPGYENTLKCIGEIEEKLIHNQNKVAIVKRNLKTSKKLNEDKLVRVRRLNEHERDVA